MAGADAELVARYAVSPMFELRAGLEWRRYWFAMHSQPGDTYIAGGAVDQSFAFTARIAILIGGSTPQGRRGRRDPAAAPPKPDAHPGKAPSDDEPSVKADGDSGEPSP